MMGRIFCQIRVYLFEHSVEKIRTTVDIADRINANTIGCLRPRFVS